MSKDDFNPSRFIERPGELKDVPIKMIHADFGFNKRVEYGNIDWLAQSIRTNGLVTPLVLFPEPCKADDAKAFFYKGSSKYPQGYYRLTVQDGHRRFKAILKAKEELGWEAESVQCRRFNEGETQEERLLNQLLMNSGKALEPIETQKIYKELILLGWKPETIAKRHGVTLVKVERMLQLSTVEEVTKYMIERGDLSASLVLDTVADVRQIASIEGKRESELYQELVETTPKTASGKVSATKLKAKLYEKKENILSKDNPMYFYNCEPLELLKRVANCVAIAKDLGIPHHQVMIPSNIWEAIATRYKEKQK